jgi:hypothetical protein
MPRWGGGDISRCLFEGKHMKKGREKEGKYERKGRR